MNFLPSTRLSLFVFLLVLGLASAPLARPNAGGNEERASWIPLKPEEPQGYPANPSKVLAPMRQDLQALRFTRLEDGSYRLEVGEGEAATGLGSVDLKSFIPRIPALAKGEPTLTRIALFQRELNRNETSYGVAPGTENLKLANNCLRSGMWELMLNRKLDGNMLMDFHGWFQLPDDEYRRLFEELNAEPYRSWCKDLQDYPDMGGFAVPLDQLRRVVDERALTVAALTDAVPVRLPEQQRKAKLLLSSGIEHYADFAKTANQPIRTAKFSEPGYYNPGEPMSFDLTWLASPASAKMREVSAVRTPAALQEIEVTFANGNRLIYGDEALAGLPVRSAPPAADTDVLRATFGISTPDIYASLADRQAEFADPRDYYLMLLDAKGNHLDNHSTGIDRVFTYRTGQELHLLLVGYERIAIVAELVLPWGG